jgi:4a-hydroxytetrahydrobiopterin dehydratase
MTNSPADALDRTLSRTAASNAVGDLGWRYLLGGLCAAVPVTSLRRAGEVAAAVVAAAGPDADGHVRLDLRPDRVEVRVLDRDRRTATRRDTQVVARIAEALDRLGLRVADVAGGSASRPVQQLELAIDVLDVGAVRPFWKAVLAFVDEPQAEGPDAGIVDPAGQLPGIWFQQMDAPRLQRNRIHLDVTVAHDEAQPRVLAGLSAGGLLLDDSYAPSFWVLADPEGNEVCVCTWTGRDERWGPPN